MTQNSTSSDDDDRAPGFASFDDDGDVRGHGRSEKTAAEMTSIPPAAVAPPAATPPPPAHEAPPQPQLDASEGAATQ